MNEKAEQFIENVLKNNIVETVITIAISILLYNIIKRVMNKNQKSKVLKEKIGKKQRTYIRVLNSVIKYAFLIVTILIVLQINGVNVNSMLAGVGILGIVIGIALQDALKDIIMGINIIVDDYFSVGDYIKYKGQEGKVVGFGLKTTKILLTYNNNILSVSNRNISEIEKVSNFIFISIPVPYEVSIGKFETIVPQIVDAVLHLENVKNCKYLGLGELGESSMNYKLSVEFNPDYKLSVGKAALRAVKIVLDENKIEVPYPQLDIHNK